jgi:hypothetical protein
VGRPSASSSITKSSRPGTVVSIYCTAGKRRRFIKQARSRQLATPQGSAPRPPRHTRHNLQAEGDPPSVWLLVFNMPPSLTVSRERDMSRTPVATASQFCFQKTSPPHHLPCFPQRLCLDPRAGGTRPGGIDSVGFRRSLLSYSDSTSFLLWRPKAALRLAVVFSSLF